MIRVALVASLVVLLSAPARAEVRVVVRPDGSTYVYNVRSPRRGKPAESRPAGVAKTAKLGSEEIDSLVGRHAGRVNGPDRNEAVFSKPHKKTCIAPLSLCTDNAVMGAIAIERLRAGQVASLDLDIRPGMVRRQG